MPPTDPLIYRFYEINLIYGNTMRAIIQEKFGEGKMNAIDYNMNIKKNPKSEWRTGERDFGGEIFADLEVVRC